MRTSSTGRDRAATTRTVLAAATVLAATAVLTGAVAEADAGVALDVPATLPAALPAADPAALPADDHDLRDGGAAVAVVRAADGTRLGVVSFAASGHGTVVRARLRLPARLGGLDAFHGLHIHANDNPANGTGCVADPAAPPNTWFLSADGHLADVGQTHGGHAGDLSSVLINPDGTADLRFTTQRFTVADLIGRAVILHAGPDNFGNVPVGAGPEQYTPNSPAATARTAATGNAGDRIGCGVITVEH